MVKYSRDQRHEREARAATERLLAGQRERELAARQSLVRARQVATVCIVLALGAVVAAVLAYVNTQRAHRAEQVALQARAGAEHLLGYLTDDFVRELESFGQLNVVAEFAKRQIDYFHGLPPALKGPETIRNGALAMVYYARAKRVLGDPDVAGVSAAEAVKLLEERRSAGDESESTIIALALAYCTRAQILDNQNDPAGQVAGKRAADLLRPLVNTPNASVASRRAYVEVSVRVGFEQLRSNLNAEAINTLQQAMRHATELGAGDLSDLSMGAYYAEAGAWLVPAQISLGRNDAARRSGQEAIAVAEKVLTRRPGYRLALHALQALVGDLALIDIINLNPLAALPNARRAEEISLTLMSFDPENIITVNNLAVARSGLGDLLWTAGQLHEAVVYYQKAVGGFAQATAGGATFIISRAFSASGLAYRLAQLGDFAAAGAAIDAGVPYLANLRKDEPKDSQPVAIVDALGKLSVAAVTYERDDFPTVQHILAGVESDLDKVRPAIGEATAQTATAKFISADLAGRAAYELRNYRSAEQAALRALASRRILGADAVYDHREMGGLTTWLAMALARQGKYAEAAKAIGPVVKFYRELAARNHGDQWVPIEFASALYAQALADKSHSAELLHEAAALIDGAMPPVRNLHDNRRWRERIAAEQAAGHG